MTLTTQMAIEIASKEAIIRQAYKDSKGNWTWSAGLTSATGHKVERYIDNPQSMAKCLEIYIWALQKYNDEVTEAFGNYELSDSQRAAALSFHWNTGAIKRASWVKSFIGGDTKTAKKQFMNYKRPASIIPRRKSERDLFFDGDWSGDGSVTEYTKLRANHTPNWSSGVKVYIGKEIEAIIDKSEPKSPFGVLNWLFG